MSIERTLYCDGPDCQVHIRTASRDRVPIGFLQIAEGDHDGPVVYEFCGWDCVLRYAAAMPPPELIEVEL